VSTAWPPDVPAFYPGQDTVSQLNVMAQSLTSLLNPPIFRAERSTALTVATGHQFVAWNTPLEDTAAAWSSGAPAIYPAPVGSWYHVHAAVSLSGTGAAGQVLIPAVSVGNSSPTGQPAGATGWEGPEAFTPTGAAAIPKVVCNSWFVYANRLDPIQIDLWYSNESGITAVDTTAGIRCRVGIVGVGV
jgi:hypothetical protein